MNKSTPNPTEMDIELLNQQIYKALINKNNENRIKNTL